MPTIKNVMLFFAASIVGAIVWWLTTKAMDKYIGDSNRGIL